MIRVIRAELIRHLRRRSLVVLGLGTALFSVVSTWAVFASADEIGQQASARAGTTLSLMSREGGATEAFAVGASFVGFLVFVTFIALIAGEMSSGTFRAVVLRNPHRMQVIRGKLAGLMVIGAGIIAVCEVLAVGMSTLLSPVYDVSTAQWWTAGGLADAGTDYLHVLAGVAGWAIFGTALAVAFRSVPVALGVGFAWAGPFENIVTRSWSTGSRVFPGQVLRSVFQGGTIELAEGRAFLTAGAYVAMAAVLTLILVSRRDVTA
jgi:ABC-2 type transport system permease protein